MKLARKCKHFLGAIKASLFGIIFCSLILLVIYIAYKTLICFSENQFASVIIGVLSSLIATVFFNVTAKYTDSIKAFKDIENIIENSCDYIKERVKKQAVCDSDKAQLWSDYMRVCALSDRLTYLGDYDRIVPAFSKLVTCPFDEIEQAKELTALNDVYIELDKFQQ